ncbi:hypothetical protein M2360_003076 [Rhizobium sp. SG_E_25_P2]|uniref:hypothetical protein n=1 Tax=Rhizobium sp. SG_E_25_P2 TaxID=2879942 RepID=UPI0024767265|nr:hypothetical protein [Rhizobium sp. SG_E_25_P2]MDH6267679.1 hypothetical protein [Rhizobium sp. SG_E_25_P2]
MRIFNILGYLAICVSLAACVQSDKDLKQLRADMKKYPDAVAAAQKDCVRNLTYWDLDTKTNAAIYMRTSKADLPKTACRRILKALASNSLQASDFVALRRDGRFTPRMIAALRNG